MPRLFDRVVTVSHTVPGSGNVLSLQAGRGFAAVVVVLFHISYSIFGLAKYWPVTPTGDLFRFGYAGVEFFFVLSGLIIYQAHRGDIGHPARLASFVWKRFRRIYPVYWVVLAAVTPLFFLYPSLGTPHQREAGSVIDGFLLIHLFDYQTRIVTVAWTLFHEVLFYGLFSLLIVNRRVGWLILCAWIGMSAASFAFGSSVSAAVEFYLSPLHLLFGIGMAAAKLVAGSRVKAPLLVLLLGTALFCATAIEEDYGRHLSLMALSLPYGVASAAILVGAIHLERSGRLTIPRPFVLLGDASYSIYLTHTVTLSALAKLLLWAEDTGFVMPPLFNFVILAIAAVALGVVFHLVVENPLLNLLRKVGPKNSRPSVRSPDGIARLTRVSGD